MVHQKSVLCTETEHFSDSISEMYTVHKDSTPYRRTVHQKCVLCTETEHFTDGAHKAVLTDHKVTFKNETQRFTIIHIYIYIYIPTYVLNTN